MWNSYPPKIEAHREMCKQNLTIDKKNMKLTCFFLCYVQAWKMFASKRICLCSQCSQTNGSQIFLTKKDFRKMQLESI